MINTIFKYSFGKDVQIFAPKGRVLLVAQRNGSDLPTVWIEHPAPPTNVLKVEYIIRGTGQEFDDDPSYEHVGSCICNAYVWHVYRKVQS